MQGMGVGGWVSKKCASLGGVHRGQTSEAFFVLFSGILFNIK